MKKMYKLIALLLAFCFMAACGTTAASSREIVASAPAPVSEAEVSAAPSQEPAQPSAEPGPASAVESVLEESPEPEPLDRSVELPLVDEPAALTLWTRTNFAGDAPLNTYADCKCIQQAEALTGVHIDFTEVSDMTEGESFNLMIAAGDYCDLIYNFLGNYGSASKAISEGIIVDLRDYLDQCPIYDGFLERNPDVAQKITTDDGALGAFYKVAEHEGRVYEGWVIRQDWLDQLKMEAPVTVDDWHDVLTAFKDTFDPSMPLAMGSSGTYNSLTSAWTAAYISTMGGYNDTFCAWPDGSVTFGPTSDEFLQYLTTMHQWYEEGILSKDFVSFELHGPFSTFTSVVTTGESGIFPAQADYISNYIETGRTTDPNYDLSGIVNIHLDADQPIPAHTSSSELQSIFSVTDGPNAALAVQWCDFWYSDVGSRLCTYGIEGESYELDANGVPQYTDLILSNPDGYSTDGMKMLYCVNYCTLFDPDAEKGTLDPVAEAAVQVWTADQAINTAAEDCYSIVNLDYLTLTTEEAEAFAEKDADINTYVSEYTLKFITGDTDLSEYAAYCKTVEDMGVQDVLEIIQNAYTRYCSRGGL